VSDNPLAIDHVWLRVVHLPYRSPFKTSFSEEHAKTAILLGVVAEGVEGLGECVMDPLPLYREEMIPGALNLLRQALIPDLLAHPVAHPRDLVARWARWRGNPMAKTGLEMAVWDAWARRAEVSMTHLLHGELGLDPAGAPTELAVGASLGMASLEASVANVTRHVEQGYHRVKLKIEPGWDVRLLEAVRAAQPTVELTVDANSAYTLADTAHLQRLDEFDLHYIEQPLHYDDLLDHATLARSLRTPLCLDETLTSPMRVRDALALQACHVVNLKVGRVGGVANTLEIHRICEAADVPMWCGGMLESGIGRAHNIHLATLPGFRYPGDTASASRTYARDITLQALETTNGMMPVPVGEPGIGVTLDVEYLDTLTVATERF
jgi:o-succinylbenzoate synthase